MLGLTAWITALVGAFWIGLTSILPTFLICAVGPILTFRILHIIWLKLSRMFNPSYDKWVKVYDVSWMWAKRYERWDFLNDSIKEHHNLKNYRKSSHLWGLYYEQVDLYKAKKRLNKDFNKTYWNVKRVYNRIK